MSLSKNKKRLQRSQKTCSRNKDYIDRKKIIGMCLFTISDPIETDTQERSYIDQELDSKTTKTTVFPKLNMNSQTALKVKYHNDYQLDTTINTNVVRVCARSIIL